MKKSDDPLEVIYSAVSARIHLSEVSKQTDWNKEMLRTFIGQHPDLAFEKQSDWIVVPEEVYLSNQMDAHFRALGKYLLMGLIPFVISVVLWSSVEEATILFDIGTAFFSVFALFVIYGVGALIYNLNLINFENHTFSPLTYVKLKLTSWKR